MSVVINKSHYFTKLGALHTFYSTFPTILKIFIILLMKKLRLREVTYLERHPEVQIQAGLITTRLTLDKQYCERLPLPTREI